MRDAVRTPWYGIGARIKYVEKYHIAQHIQYKIHSVNLNLFNKILIQILHNCQE